ncbi:MAG: S4 domain-containing protein YaaA [Erysipelotrichaceae bacterium]|nr:S4 domain-containing protein YaaA [Erysipelotrichaceae bacterium]
MAIIEKVEIKEDFITLGQFLKLVDLISSGGEVKYFLAENTVLINHETDNRRGRKLYKNDLIEVASKTYRIC